MNRAQLSLFSETCSDTLLFHLRREFARVDAHRATLTGSDVTRLLSELALFGLTLDHMLDRQRLGKFHRPPERPARDPLRSPPFPDTPPRWLYKSHRGIARREL
jgi:hypothetical protein